MPTESHIKSIMDLVTVQSIPKRAQKFYLRTLLLKL